MSDRRAASSIHTLLAATSLYLLSSLTAVAEPLALEFEQAKAGIDERTGEPIVSIVFTEQSGRTFSNFTAKNVGKPLEMRVDGQAVMRSVLREPILGGTLRITGRFSRQEVEELARRLSTGAGKLEVETVD